MALPADVASPAVNAAATEKTKVMMMTVRPYRLQSSCTIADLYNTQIQRASMFLTQKAARYIKH